MLSAYVHAIAYVVPATAANPRADVAAWASAVATVASWPVAEPLQPVLEHRLARTGQRGALREVIVCAGFEPLGLVAPGGTDHDLRELLRPLRRVRALRPLRGARAVRALALPTRHVAELRRLDPRIPEGRWALAPLFDDLCEGLAALGGPVALRLLVMPAPAGPLSDEDAEVEESRRLRFSLELRAERPLPATLRARAEALCLSQRASTEAWTVGDDPDEEPLALPGVAAVRLSLPLRVASSVRIVEGRPFEGPLRPDGAVMGRVRKLDGRPAAWRLGLGVAPPPRLPGRGLGVRQEHRDVAPRRGRPGRAPLRCGRRPARRPRRRGPRPGRRGRHDADRSARSTHRPARPARPPRRPGRRASPQRGRRGVAEELRRPGVHPRDVAGPSCPRGTTARPRTHARRRRALRRRPRLARPGHRRDVGRAAAARGGQPRVTRLAQRAARRSDPLQLAGGQADVADPRARGAAVRPPRRPHPRGRAGGRPRRRHVPPARSAQLRHGQPRRADVPHPARQRAGQPGQPSGAASAAATAMSS